MRFTLLIELMRIHEDSVLIGGCRASQMQPLSAFCEAVRASCHAVRKIVISAAVCEVSFFIHGQDNLCTFSFADYCSFFGSFLACYWETPLGVE